MRYVLGIDSGGTKCQVCALSLNGSLLGNARGASCTHYGRSHEEALILITRNIDACLAGFAGRREDCAYLICGAAGYDSEEDGQIIRSLYESVERIACPMKFVNDACLAHHTVTGGTGVVLIAGTGSIAYGVNDRGVEARVGGWMHTIMSDEGSGRYIDAWALHHLSRFFDGCRDLSPLIAAIRERTGINTRKQLMDYAARMGTPPWDAPGLGGDVSRAAERGDPYAIEIMKHAAAWNFRLVDEVARKLGYGSDSDFVVGLWGSAILKNRVQQEEAISRIIRAYPRARICISETDAATGAAQWAANALRASNRA